MLADLTLTDWGSWAAIIAGSIALIGFVIYIVTLVINKVKSSRLFDAYYEQEDDNFTNIPTPSIKTSSQEQYLRVTLIMKTSASIDTVKVKFNGEGQPPVIKSLSDRDVNGPNGKIRTIREKDTNSNTFIESGWRQLQDKHRDEGDKIRINIYYLARNTFKGNLEIFLSCNKNLSRRVLLPLDILAENDAETVN